MEAEKPLRCHGGGQESPFTLHPPTLAYSPVYHYYMEILSYTHVPIASVTLYHSNNGTSYSHPNFVIDCTITSLLGILISAGVEVPQKGQQLCRFKGTMMLITMVSFGVLQCHLLLGCGKVCGHCVELFSNVKLLQVFFKCSGSYITLSGWWKS